MKYFVWLRRDNEILEMETKPLLFKYPKSGDRHPTLSGVRYLGYLLFQVPSFPGILVTGAPGIQVLNWISYHWLSSITVLSSECEIHVVNKDTHDGLVLESGSPSTNHRSSWLLPQPTKDTLTLNPKTRLPKADPLGFSWSPCNASAFKLLVCFLELKQRPVHLDSTLLCLRCRSLDVNGTTRVLVVIGYSRVATRLGATVVYWKRKFIKG